MVYRRKRNYGRKKKSAYRKRRYNKRYRRSKLNGPRIYTFKRTNQLTDLTAPGGGGSCATPYSPSLSNMPSFSDFTNLFDQYRIVGVRFEFVPKYDQNDGAGTSQFELVSVIDRNDIALPTFISALQFQSMKKTKNSKRHVRYFKPTIALTQTDVSATSFVGTYKCPWISCTNTNIAHGFLKVVSDANPNPTAYTWSVWLTMYVQFRNVN